MVNEWSLDWRDANRVATRVGDSFYVFDADQLQRNAQAVTRAFSQVYPRVRAAYAFKANHLPAVCRVAIDCGLGADLASDLDLWLAQRLDVPSARMVLTSAALSVEALTFAFTAGATVNLDSLRDVRLAMAVRSQLPPGASYPIGLRCALPMGDGSVQRLGLDPNGEEFAEAVALIRASDGVRLAGLHGHVPGHAVADFAERVTTLLDIAQRWLPNELEYLDVGGGFYGGVPSWPTLADGPAPRFADYAEAIRTPLERTHGRLADPPLLIVEPGTSMVANAFTYVTRVRSIKRRDDRGIATVAGTLLDTSPNTRRVDFPVQVLRAEPSHPTEPAAASAEAAAADESAAVVDADASHPTYDIVGSTLIEGEYLALNVPGPIEEGDFVMFANVGAYSLSFATTFLQPQVAVVQRDAEGKWRVVRPAGNPQTVFGDIPGTNVD